MSSRNSTDWMWSQACELIEQAERMHRQFFRLISSERTQAVWEPPVDVFEDEREVTIIIALPGVPAGCIEVNDEADALVVRAERRPPPPSAIHGVAGWGLDHTPWASSDRKARLGRRASQNGRFQVHSCPQTRRGVVMLIEHQAVKPNLLTIFVFIEIRVVVVSTDASKTGL